MTPADRAVLACCLEVAGTPKPGNVDRERDHPDMRFEHMLAGAQGAAPGLRLAAGGGAIGPAFERAVAGMYRAAGRNTHVGALLLLVPLVRADELAGPVLEGLVEETTVADARAFYRAFDGVPVAVDDPPTGAADLDVRRGVDALEAVDDRGITLSEVLALAAPRDDVAREWTVGFERSLAAASMLAETQGPIELRVAETYLQLLAERPDSLVVTRHGEAVAAEVVERAAALVDDGGVSEARTEVAAFADELVDRGVNPGTTADITAAGTYVALERGWLP